MFNQHQISRSHFIKTLPIPIPIPIPIPSTILVMPMSTSCFVCFRFILGNHSSSSDRIAAAAYSEDEATSLFDLKNGVITRFTWSQMEKFTSLFSQVIGFGGFSTVYLAQLPDSSLAAVKIYGGNSHRLSCIYKQELGILLSLRHDNIVKFIGYSHNQEEEESALVFEYLSNGNLQEKLHHKQEGAVIPWRNRTAIAFQLAEAIEYLHHKCTLPVIHGDIKASNILLDQQLNCKLCDFGSAKMGFSSTVLPSSKAGRMMMLGSPGYTDPHYLRTGISSKKNDIYSFGVIVLELITGMEAVSSQTGERLTSVAGPLLKDLSESNVAKLVDPCLKMGGGFDLEEVKAMASISAMCLSDFRPSASDIVNTMRNIMSFSNTSSAISPHKL